VATVIPQSRGFDTMDENNRPARPSLKDRARYLFDKSMSAGTIALIGWLGAMSLVIILIASALIVVMGIAPEGEPAPHDFVETGWESLMRTIDAGTLGGDQGWAYRLVMLLVTIAGIFIFSALIGVLSSGLEAKIAELRKGRSRVLEEGHSVILNWSASIVDIIGELAQANPSAKKLTVVILAERDKVEMEDEIAAKLNLRGVQVICRSGDPCDPGDLDIVNPGAAKSIIVLAPEVEDADAQVIKTVLAITNGPSRGPRPFQIVAEVREADQCRAGADGGRIGSAGGAGRRPDRAHPGSVDPAIRPERRCSPNCWASRAAKSTRRRSMRWSGGSLARRWACSRRAC
jgi:hypothetical protein